MRRWLLLHVSMRVNLAIVSDFLCKLFTLPMAFFDTKHTGDIMQRMGDHDRVEQFLTGGALTVLFSAATFCVFGFVLLAYDAVVFGVFMAFSLLYGLWIRAFLGRRRVLDRERFGKAAEAQDTTWQLVTTMQEAKLQDCRLRRRREWEEAEAALYGVRMKGLKLQQAEEAGGVLINGVKNVVVTVLAAMAVIDGRLTLGQMLAVQYIIGQLSAPVESLLGFVYSLQDVRLSLERIGEVHQAKGEGREGALTAFATKGRTLSLQGVTFRYDPNAPSPTLSGVSLDIAEGKTTAIVGVSGSGQLRNCANSITAISDMLHTSRKYTSLRMLEKMLRPSSTASIMVENLSSVRIIRAALLETSVPFLPIAMPTSAALSAGASLTPSPVIATTSPRACHALTILILSSGLTRAYTE